MMASRRKNAPLIGIPPSVRMVDLAVKHGFTPKTDEQKRAVRDQFRLEEATASLNVPAPNSRSALRYDTEIDDSWANLPVMAIHFYERNPRKANNEAYAELKESIRVNGILQPLSVTKRPGESHYILYAGGNTRLQAIRELWEETGDIKYRDTRVIIKSWRGEASVLLAHMAENTQRNDMTFWDRANGTLEIKRQMEEERGEPLSHREFEAEIKKFGLQTDIRTLSMYRFAVERIPDIGPFLSGLSVRTIQPRLNLLLRLANHHDIEEDVFYSEVVTVTAKALLLRIQGGDAAFSSELFLQECDVALASRLEMDNQNLARMLTAMERFPDMTLEDLRKLCKPAPTVTASSAKPEIQSTNKTDAVTGNSRARIALDDGEAQPEISLQSPAGTTPEIMALVQSLLVKASLGTCYEIAPGMPLGYLMGFPKDGPLDLKEDAQSRQAAWWVLAMASGQFDPDTCRAGLDESSTWRALILEESDAQTLGGLELEIQHNIGGQGEFLSIPWLMNPDNPVAGACLDLLSVIRGGATS